VENAKPDPINRRRALVAGLLGTGGMAALTGGDALADHPLARDWRDGAAGGTPLSSAALEDLEHRMMTYADSKVGGSNYGSAAGIRYVREGGDDALSGLTWTDAKRSVQSALAAGGGAGTVIVDEGGYPGPFTIDRQRVVGQGTGATHSCRRTPTRRSSR
jgi:hypothetical protein